MQTVLAAFLSATAGAEQSRASTALLSPAGALQEPLLFRQKLVLEDIVKEIVTRSNTDSVPHGTQCHALASRYAQYYSLFPDLFCAADAAQSFSTTPMRTDGFKSFCQAIDLSAVTAVGRCDEVGPALHRACDSLTTKPCALDGPEPWEAAPPRNATALARAHAGLADQCLRLDVSVTQATLVAAGDAVEMGLRDVACRAIASREIRPIYQVIRQGAFEATDALSCSAVNLEQFQNISSCAHLQEVAATACQEVAACTASTPPVPAQ